jgi:tetratricopeptide (TPR) repeat protein
MMKTSLSVEQLNELANNLYFEGRTSDAIKMFDSALVLLNDVTNPSSEDRCSKALEDVGDKGLSTSENIHCEFRARSLEPQYAPDSFLEGECDVGPRAVFSLVYIDYCPPEIRDMSLAKIVIVYNKGVVHHMDGNHENATDTYSLALAALRTYSPPLRISSAATISFLSHIRTLIHNNMGQICYLDCDDHNALAHFDEALRLSKQVSHFKIGNEWNLEVATFASNLARTHWMTGNIFNDIVPPIFWDVLHLRSSCLPREHPDVVCAHLNIGLLLYLRDDKERAKVHIEEYLQHAMRHGSNLDPIPAMAYSLIIGNEDKDDQDSIELVQSLRLLLNTRRDLGNDNATIASLLNKIGTILVHRRQVEESAIFYSCERKVGENKFTEQMKDSTAA